MNLREFAQQQKQARVARDFTHPEPPPEPQRTAPTGNNPIARAQKIIAEYKLSHEIAEGCRLQILKDIENKENPYRILLCAAEAIGRLDFRGDDFFLQVQAKLKEVYGADPSEEQSKQ